MLIKNTKSITTVQYVNIKIADVEYIPPATTQIMKVALSAFLSIISINIWSY